MIAVEEDISKTHDRKGSLSHRGRIDSELSAGSWIPVELSVCIKNERLLGRINVKRCTMRHDHIRIFVKNLHAFLEKASHVQVIMRGPFE